MPINLSVFAPVFGTWASARGHKSDEVVATIFHPNLKRMVAHWRVRLCGEERVHVVHQAAFDWRQVRLDSQSEFIVKPRRFQVQVDREDLLSEADKMLSGICNRQCPSSSSIIRIKCNRLHVPSIL